LTDYEAYEETDEDGLRHIGIKRRSGRYPWGSGDDPFQRSRGFKAYMEEMKAQGLSNAQIAKGLTEYANEGRDKKDHIKVSSTDVAAATQVSTNYIFAENQAMAFRLKEKGMANTKIAEQMGTNESTVRGWLKASTDIKENSLQGTANALKEHLETSPYLDVGKGTELHMGIAGTKLQAAIVMLRDEGYNLYHMSAPQLGTGKDTRMKILTHPERTWKDTHDAMIRGEIGNVTAQSKDGGLNFFTPKEMPVSVSSKHLEVRYGPDGGDKMDGVIELRRGVDDLSLGANRYAQVRIAVDGTHYLKGMAMYADDLPAGVNMRFNTNKKREDAPNKLDALKPMKTDKDGNIDAANPFGATTRPQMFVDKSGKEKTSPLNIVNEEGSWDQWSKSLSSQMLSKQPVSLASQQLRRTQASRRQDLDDILRLTNPVVRQKLLDDFAESADAAAVHLKAAAMDRQSSHVILPMNSMRPNEVYARNFNDGDRVVLVRYPHGGPFEIPELTVNNKNPAANRILGNARDAIGIHHTVAEQLSGADFDGDAVLVIPNPTRQIKTRPPLKQLEGFDPKRAYPIPDDDTTIKRMTKKNTQTEMGKISNLITDMTIHGASDAELARAVKHSMVVIDAEKHSLNYKQSERDNNIAELKTNYQGGPRRGAATLISRSSATARIDEVKQPHGKAGVDPVTGRKILEPTGRSYVKVTEKVSKRTGEVVTTEKTVMRKTKGTQMEFTTDARALLSKNPTPMEELYASHANNMKDLANQARRSSLAIVSPRQSKAARAIYSKEVQSLTEKLRLAERNKPLERQAQIVGKAMAKNRIDANPGYDNDDIKKIKYQSLEEARTRVGANKKKIGSEVSPLTDREWEAIQAGAFSSTTLRSILANADMDRVTYLATPRARTALTPGQLARAKQMVASGRGMSEIAEELGLPRSTLVDNINQ